jgi:methanogenic corrinoid protein MtbC1
MGCGHDDARVDELRRAYCAALLMGDEIAAEAAIRNALRADLSTAVIDNEIIGPAMWLIGDLWQRGEIGVADEHIATQISIRVLALQREAQRTVGERPGRRVMLATPAGEVHDVALRMVANLLREAGFGIVMLGPDVPSHELATCARRHRPDVVCLSATMPGGADSVLISIHEMQRSWPHASYLVGGRDLGSRLRPRPGIDVCADVAHAVDAVDALVKRADMN